MNRQFIGFGDSDQNAAARGAVQFCHYETCNACHALENLNLLQGVLTNRRIKHKQHGMWRFRVSLLDHSDNFFELCHELNAIL